MYLVESGSLFVSAMARPGPPTSLLAITNHYHHQPQPQCLEEFGASRILCEKAFSRSGKTVGWYVSIIFIERHELTPLAGAE